MMRFPRLILRRYGLEAEFASGLALFLWGLLAYFTLLDMAERPSFAILAGFTDHQWGIATCGLGAVQLACVIVNNRWARYLISYPVALFWCDMVGGIVYATVVERRPMILSLSTYAAMAVCTLFKVFGKPREFPPRG